MSSTSITIFFLQISSICHSIRDSATLHLSCKFDATTRNNNWLVSTSSSSTKYALNRHEDLEQYAQYLILPSKIMPRYGHPASLVNRNKIPIELSLTNPSAWWCHQMETFSALLAICAGNSPVPGEFPTQRPVTRSFDVYFDLRLNKWLSKQSWG